MALTMTKEEREAFLADIHLAVIARLLRLRAGQGGQHAAGENHDNRKAPALHGRLRVGWVA